MSIESVLILGVGNSLLGDEGVGIHVVRAIREIYRDQGSIEYIDGGTLSFTLAEPIARADGLIVVDAARMNSSPGTVKVFHDTEMDRYLKGNRQSVHEVSLTDLLDIARLTESLPKKRSLIGIEPRSIDWNESLSPEVQPAVDRAISEIVTILSNWRVSCPKRSS